MSPRAIAVATLGLLYSVGVVTGEWTPSPDSSPPTTQAAETRRPPPVQIPLPQDTLTDERIKRALRRGGDFLIKRFDRRTLQLRLPQEELSNAYGCGLDALCVYALMQTGLALNETELGPQGKLMQGMIEGMKRLPAGRGNPQTYARALRATALSVFNRKEDRQTLQEDMDCLIVGQTDGAYTYASAIPDPNRRRPPKYHRLPIWDNSNSQYGFLGVWSSAEAGLEVPSGYWVKAEKHWIESQLNNGGWTYGEPGLDGQGATVSMTAAGVATLFVVRDFANFGDDDREVGKPAFPRGLQQAMDWWEADGNALRITSGNLGGYTLYGVERVGLASGFKYFGTHDWYRDLARNIVERQRDDGGWRAEVQEKPSNRESDKLETAYTLLFLSRARHPILMNKLRFERYWSNRYRDLAGLTRYASKRLERPLNWQVVPIARNWSDWTDAPIVYLASHTIPKLTDADYDNLRSFALAGGLIFTHTDEDGPGSGKAFDQWVEKKFCNKLFPQYEMSDLPAEHPIYNFPAKLSGRVPLRGVSNGWRLLLVHSPHDLAYRWQRRDEWANPDAFRTGLNLFVYAAGTRDFRKRLEPTYVPEPPGKPSLAVTVARLKYAGAWDPEPYAWERFARQLRWKTSYQMNVQPTPWRELRAETAPFAHLTGSVRYDPTAAEMAALKRYVQEGGVLLIDDCGGRGDFARSMRKALEKAWPQQPLAPMAPTSPALNAGEPGMADVSKPKLRPSVIDKVDAATRELKELSSGGCVVFSDIDVTCGLLGANTYGLKGYEPTYAQSLVSNLLLWTLDGHPLQATTR